MLNSIFVIKVIGVVVFLPTSLRPISTEVLLMGGAVDIAGSRFKMPVIWLNLEEGIRRVDVLPSVLTILHN